MKRCIKVIERTGLFSDLTRYDLVFLAKSMQKEIFLPGDVITRTGGLDNSLYCIYCGTVALFTVTGIEVSMEYITNHTQITHNFFNIFTCCILWDYGFLQVW